MTDLRTKATAVVAGAPSGVKLDRVVSTHANRFSSDKDYCGYHDAIPCNCTYIAYAVLASPACRDCGEEIGDFMATYSHELAEACTDKVPGCGWLADDGQETSDLEAWTLFGWGPPSDPNRYTVQGYYTNERGNTVWSLEVDHCRR